MNKVFESAYVYALLIFFGFYNYYCFYNHFDINIATFLTSGELLLSFLPLTFPIVLIASSLMVFYIIVVTQISLGDKKNKQQEENILPLLFIFGRAWKSLKISLAQKKLSLSLKIRSVLADILGLIVGIVFILFFAGSIFYFLVCVEGKYSSPNIPLLIVIACFWLIMFNDLLEFFYKKNIKAINISRLCVVILLSIGLINISSSEKAKEILNKTSLKTIVFEYNSKKIKSDSNLVYIGKTEKYLFLRDLKRKQNYIYSTDKVGMILMTATN